mmetsp:Transcript_49372/g.123775  ORF Transcript_49372/g.123775 Transcript_49372/m.123775 type:complete len:88 (-) Transcript_49372:514-777(-)
MSLKPPPPKHTEQPSLSLPQNPPTWNELDGKTRNPCVSQKTSVEEADRLPWCAECLCARAKEKETDRQTGRRAVDVVACLRACVEDK